MGSVSSLAPTRLVSGEEVALGTHLRNWPLFPDVLGVDRAGPSRSGLCPRLGSGLRMVPGSGLDAGVSQAPSVPLPPLRDRR